MSPSFPGGVLGRIRIVTSPVRCPPLLSSLLVKSAYFHIILCLLAAGSSDITFTLAVFFDIEIYYNEAVRQTPLRLLEVVSYG